MKCPAMRKDRPTVFINIGAQVLPVVKPEYLRCSAIPVKNTYVEYRRP